MLNPDQIVDSPGLFLWSVLTSQEVHVEGTDPPRGEEAKSAKEGSQRAGLMDNPGEVGQSVRGERDGALHTSRKKLYKTEPETFHPLPPVHSLLAFSGKNI